MSYPKLYLKPKEGRRIQAGHDWVYSNEIDTKQSPLKQFQPGQLVQLCQSDKQPIGIVTINPQSLLCARVLSRDVDAVIDHAWFVSRIASAKQWRDDYFDGPYYRAIYSDGDGLSGLIVDRFGDYLVVQINSAGMENLKQQLVSALIEVYQPKAILLRNDTAGRQMENLAEELELAYGDMPESILMEENHCQFHINPYQGQKTGWFYDHRPNRQVLVPLAKDKTVLDVFAYLGAWSMPLARAGAKQLTCVDVSSKAMEQLQENAKLNGVADRVSTICADAFDAMNELLQQGKRFDLIILDPPAFAKRKKDINNARKAYQRANGLALQLLAPGGYLMSASCSFHMSEADLLQAVNKAAAKQGARLQLLYRGGQGLDHPVQPMIPETAYLKALLFRKT